jgi:oxygen-dependent protoporphyrinogen oxidase
VFFGFEKKQLQSELSGSGLIAPPGEAEILAATFISSKWPHRAPQGKALVRAFLGGSRQDISHTGNEELVSIAERELKALLGDFGKPEFHRVHRYEKGTPQPELGHRERLADIFAEVDALPWLSLIGSGYGAVGIPDCIRQGKQVAEQISNNQ